LSQPADASQGVLPTLTLSWAAAARATSYTVEVSTTADFATLAFSQTGVTGTSLAIPAGRLSPGAAYFWRVRAVNAAGQTTSSVRSFVTLAAPASFSVVSPAQNATGVRTPLTLSWWRATRATTYSVIIASDQAFGQVVATASGLTAPEFTPPEDALEPGRQYWWRVIATNAAG